MSDPEINAMAFVNGATEFKVAGDDLCGARYLGQTTGTNVDPAYVLYFHAAELALKGCLRVHGRSTRELRNIGHDLSELLAMAEPFMRLSGDERDTARQVARLLTESNEHQGLRYFSTEQRNLPDLPYTTEGVGIIVSAAQTLVEAANPTGGRGRIDFTISKPQEA